MMEQQGEEEEEEEEEEVEVDVSNEIPRGGPIYVPNLVGPLTRLSDFESAVVNQLQSLEAQVCWDSSQVCEHDDISVEELKIFTEEELVNLALNQALKDGEQHNPHNPHNQLHNSNPRKKGHPRKSKSGDETNTNTNTNTKNINKSRKIKKRKTTNHAVEDSYIAKVEEIAKIKQKQDEDKAAATLHSYNASCKLNEFAIPSSERIERLKSCRSTNSSSKQVKSSNIQEHRAVLYPEVVLCVEVYHNIRKWVKTQELLILGCQALTELRDKIYCSMDQVMQKAGQHDPSGYFLIEDVFYNDLRDPSAIDYSEPIFDWLKNSKDDALKKWECINTGELPQKQKAIVGNVTTSDLPHFKAFDMHKIRFCDLRFRLGAGYLYCHQGACKHLIVIRDMRLIHPEDVHNRAAYPIVTFQLKLRIQKCKVCKISRATKVTVDDKWAQENPCYFCDCCYSLLHSKDGPPLYSDYSVYDYLHE